MSLKIDLIQPIDYTMPIIVSNLTLCIPAELSCYRVRACIVQEHVQRVRIKLGTDNSTEWDFHILSNCCILS